MRRYASFFSSGFTLIELMIVAAITAILVGGGIAAYNRFNESQILNQAAITLKTNLRDAQNRGLSGEKQCPPCDGVDNVCGNNDDEPFDGWQVTFDADSNNYTMVGRCGSETFPYPAITVNLPSELQISTLPSPNPILFKSLTHGTNIQNDSTEITLRVVGNPDRTRAIRVYRSGDIVIP